jgi:tetratricopeptide (TPR) repeat protein
MAQKRFTQAETVISKLIDAMPEQDLGYYMQAQNQLASGNKAVALEHLRKAYSLNPANLGNVTLLARVEQSVGNHDRAMKLAEEIIEAAPDSALGYLLKGDALLLSKKNKEALTNYDKAWSYQQSRDLVLRRFSATRRLSNVEEAAPIITSWVEQQPDDAVAMRELANAYLVEKQNKKAELYLEKVLVLQPDNADALNDLAWLYGLENDPRALELAKKAYALKPQSPGIIDTYGWILFKNEKSAEALTLLKQAADKLPDQPEVQYHYAKALFSAGDTAAAKKILKPLIESGQAFDGRADAEKMLAE